MKIIVCGGRNEPDDGFVEEYLDNMKPRPSLIITGGASGIDAYAHRWALKNGVPNCIFEACWDKIGPSAGPLRNGWMLKFAMPDMILAFPGGKGTSHMCSTASSSGYPVKRAKRSVEKVTINEQSKS